jgi:uncharacterized protein YbjT (DUF2867 family)
MLITGASGRLGRELIARAGGDVRLLSRQNLPGGRLFQGALGDRDVLHAGLRDVGVVIHAASDPRNAEAVDVEGTRALVRLAEETGGPHVIYVSIAGVDRSDYAYYRAKHEAEKILRASALPWTILRATQFHGFVLDRLRSLGLDEGGEVLVPEGVRFQSVDIREVAERLLQLAGGPPRREVEDFAGPQVLPVEAMAEAYLRRRNRPARVRSAPLPGVFAPFRTGVNIPPSPVLGRLTWEQFLDDALASPPRG